ncbi:porin family protein [Flagellimonas sp.]|uniref:porin family protein n=1 Tax=Flagellimonas sp. TaxID=2058762 RepID=UPI003AB6B3DD
MRKNSKTNSKKIIMFKKSLIITTTLFGVLITNAQDNGDFEFGVNAGLNLANVSTIDGQNSASTRISFNAGVIGEYFFSDRWGIKAKLTYDSKGWSDGFIEGEDFDAITTNFKLDYLTIPITANWHFGSNRNWYLHFGPYIGVLISAKDSELGLDLKDGFKSSDLGLALGIGHKFEINDNTKLFIELDGQSGLTDIFEINPVDPIRNTRSSLNFGLLFNL